MRVVFLFSAFTDIAYFLSGRTQIRCIYIPPGIQRFKTFQNNFAVPLRFHAKIDPSGHILSEINNRFSFRCHDDFPGFQTLHFPYFTARLGRQRVFGKRNHAHFLKVLFRIPFFQSGIIMFPVIDFRKGNRPRPSLPAFIRSENLLPSVPIPHRHLHQEGRPCPIIIPKEQKSHLSLVPAGAQHGFQIIFPLFQKRRHIIRLITQMFMIRSPAGRHFILSRLLAVYEKTIQAKRRGTHKGRRHFAVYKNPVPQAGTSRFPAVLLRFSGNKLRLPLIPVQNRRHKG